MQVVVEQEGAEDVYVELPCGATVGDLRRAVLEVFAGDASGLAPEDLTLRCGGVDGGVGDTDDEATALIDLAWGPGLEHRMEVSLAPAVVARQHLAAAGIPITAVTNTLFEDTLAARDWKRLRWVVASGRLAPATVASLSLDACLAHDGVVEHLVDDCGVDLAADLNLGVRAFDRILIQRSTGFGGSTSIRAARPDELARLQTLFRRGAHSQPSAHRQQPVATPRPSYSFTGFGVQQPTFPPVGGVGSYGAFGGYGFAPVSGTSAVGREPLFCLPTLAASADECAAVAMLEVLVGCGADVTRADATTRALPLHNAAAAHLPALTAAFLAAGSDPTGITVSGETPLHLAAAARPELPTGDGRPDPQRAVVKALLDAVADASPQDPAPLAAFVNTRDARGRSAVHDAAVTASPETLELLLAAGADVNAVAGNQVGPLHIVARRGGADGAAMAAALLSRGADIDASDELKKRPLHLAAEAGDDAMIEVLLTAGATVDARDHYKKTPLMLASIYCSPAVSGSRAGDERYGGVGAVRRLLAAGADPTLRDGNQRTPLHLAAWVGRGNVAQVLLEVPGVDPFAKDAMRNTPYRCAVVAGYSHVAALLPRGGARGATGTAAAAAPSRFASVIKEKRHQHWARGAKQPGDVEFCLVESAHSRGGPPREAAERHGHVDPVGHHAVASAAEARDAGGLPPRPPSPSHLPHTAPSDTPTPPAACAAPASDGALP